MKNTRKKENFILKAFNKIPLKLACATILGLLSLGTYCCYRDFQQKTYTNDQAMKYSIELVYNDEVERQTKEFEQSIRKKLENNVISKSEYYDLLENFKPVSPLDFIAENSDEKTKEKISTYKKNIGVLRDVTGGFSFASALASCIIASNYSSKKYKQEKFEEQERVYRYLTDPKTKDIIDYNSYPEGFEDPNKKRDY